MYVAMTRAKKEVHLFSGNGFYSSEFVKELKKNSNQLKQTIALEAQDIQIRINSQNFFAPHIK